jgi:hypothetical protein
MITSKSIQYIKAMKRVFFIPSSRVCDFLGLLALLLQIINIIPKDIFSDNPPTGGDMGSHYWPFLTLLEHGFRTLTWPVWNPGNLLGEPQLLHYFPLPFLVMGVLSLFVPTAVSFKLAVVIPILILPITTYLMVRRLNFKFPSPLFAAVVVQYVLFNENYSMWGGNILSTLSGQFAHLYAIVFLFLGLGTLSLDVSRERLPRSAVWFSLVAISHAYILLGLPICVLSFVLFSQVKNIKSRFAKSVEAGIYSFLFSIWFVLPLWRNLPWTTSFSFKWISKNIWAEVFPSYFLPLALAAILAGVGIIVGGLVKKNVNNIFRDLLLWVFPAICFLGFYFLFPVLGLVDIRALPQVLLFIAILIGVLLGIALKMLSPAMTVFVSVPVVLFSVWWISSFNVNADYWFRWNFSGVESKPLYHDLKKITAALKGDYSDPRIIYSHSLINNRAGTPRVFEMLPLYAKRATLESLYMESNILSPSVYYLQALISKTPSCPHQGSPCPHFDITRALDKLALFGVSDMILTDEEVIAQANDQSQLTNRFSYGPWTVFSMKQASLVNLPVKITIISETEWREDFFNWFISDNSKKNVLVVSKKIEEFPVGPDNNCDAKLEVDFNKLILFTTCPNRFHLLKFAYHPNWKSLSGEQIYLTSPGFLGLVPNQSKVELVFSNPRSWQIAAGLSAFAFLVYLMLLFRESRRQEK